MEENWNASLDPVKKGLTKVFEDLITDRLDPDRIPARIAAITANFVKDSTPTLDSFYGDWIESAYPAFGISKTELTAKVYDQVFYQMFSGFVETFLETIYDFAENKLDEAYTIENRLTISKLKIDFQAIQDSLETSPIPILDFN